jgi:hypothetical protein
MENVPQLQCKALRRLEKIRRRKKQWRTMKKTMRRAIGTVGKSRRMRGWTPEDQGDGAARESPPSGMRRFGILVMPRRQ